MAILITKECPQCGNRLRVKTRHRDGNKFLGCSAYPGCSFTEDMNNALYEMGQRIEEMSQRIRDLEEERQQPFFNFRRTATAAGADELRELIFKFHPDRNPNGLSAHDVVAALNELREKQK